MLEERQKINIDIRATEKVNKCNAPKDLTVDTYEGHI